MDSPARVTAKQAAKSQTELQPVSAQFSGRSSAFLTLLLLIAASLAAMQSNCRRKTLLHGIGIKDNVRGTGPDKNKLGNKPMETPMKNSISRRALLKGTGAVLAGAAFS